MTGAQLSAPGRGHLSEACGRYRQGAGRPTPDGATPGPAATRLRQLATNPGYHATVQDSKIGGVGSIVSDSYKSGRPLVPDDPSWQQYTVEERRRYEQAVAQWGGPEAAEPTEYERKLMVACEGLSIEPNESLTALTAIEKAAAGAHPLPQTVTETLEEFRYVQDRAACIDAFMGDSAPAMSGLLVRTRVLEKWLPKLAARDIHELRLKTEWFREYCSAEVPPEFELRTVFLDTLLADLERLPKAAETAPAGRRTNAEKRQAVIEALQDPKRASWSDRAIAREAGVSPQTVSTWRKRLAADGDLPQPVERMVRRGNSTYRMRTANIGQRPEEDAAAEEERPTADAAPAGPPETAEAATAPPEPPDPDPLELEEAPPEQLEPDDLASAEPEEQEAAPAAEPAVPQDRPAFELAAADAGEETPEAPHVEAALPEDAAPDDAAGREDAGTPESAAPEEIFQVPVATAGAAEEEEETEEPAPDDILDLVVQAPEPPLSEWLHDATEELEKDMAAALAETPLMDHPSAAHLDKAEKDDPGKRRPAAEEEDTGEG